MDDHGAAGAWWAYPIYVVGLVVGMMSPEQWLIALSLVAVIIRIIIDIPRACEAIRKLRWWGDN